MGFFCISFMTEQPIIAVKINERFFSLTENLTENGQKQAFLFQN